MSEITAFAPGSYIRYSSIGPRRVLSGCIGIVTEASKKAAEHGWVTVEIGGRIDDYARDELETAYFWAFASNCLVKWRGPFRQWDEAKAAVCDMLAESVPFPSVHPLSHKRDELAAWFGTVLSTPSGAVGHHQTGGEFRIEVGGDKPPPLFDKRGKQYA